MIKEEPAYYIARIRLHSAYRTMRLFVDFTTILSAGVSLATIVVGLVPLLRWKPGVSAVSVGGLVLPLAAVPVLMCLGLFGIFATVAARQASLVLVDIADMLIDRNRSGWSFGSPGERSEPAESKRGPG